MPRSEQQIRVKQGDSMFFKTSLTVDGFPVKGLMVRCRFQICLLNLFSDHIEYISIIYRRAIMCLFSIQSSQLHEFDVPSSNTWKRMEDPSPTGHFLPRDMTTGQQSHDESEQQRWDMAGPGDV